MINGTFNEKKKNEIKGEGKWSTCQFKDFQDGTKLQPD